MSITFSPKTNKKILTATTLDKAEINVEYVITDCSLAGALQNRLAELGLTSNAKITVIKKAPLGDPIEISIRGYRLCIRAREAKHYIIKRQENEEML